MQIDTISAIEGTYAFKKVSIEKPYLRFELTTRGNNLMRNFSAVADSALTEPDSAVVAYKSDDVEDKYLNFFKLLKDYFYEMGRVYAIIFIHWIVSSWIKKTSSSTITD